MRSVTGSIILIIFLVGAIAAETQQQKETLNIGGGRSSSATQTLEMSVGQELVVGVTSSATRAIQQGFWSGDFAPTACIFCDDFEDDVQPDWLVVKPNFIETGGNYVGTPSGRKAESVATPVFSGCANCSFEASMMTTGGALNKIWMLAWHIDKQNTVELLMKEENDRWILKQRINRTIVAKGKGISPILPNTSYTAKINFNGTSFQVSIDGVPLFEVPAAAGSTPFGAVGFRVKNTTGTFGYVLVN